MPEIDLRHEVIFLFLEEEKDTGKDFIKRPSRTTGKMGCTAFINVRVDSKSPENSWMINKTCFEHNHPISEDERLYSVNRKLDAENQELIIHLMSTGTLPREALKVSSISASFHWVIMLLCSLFFLK